MLDHAVLKSVAEQLMGSTTATESSYPFDSPSVPSGRSGQAVSQKTRDHLTTLRAGYGARTAVHPTEVVVEGRASRVMRTGSRRFLTVRFVMGGREYQAIEQNPEKPSRWGQLAREGHRVVQFRDLASGKYVAVVVDGNVTEYGR